MEKGGKGEATHPESCRPFSTARWKNLRELLWQTTLSFQQHHVTSSKEAGTVVRAVRVSGMVAFHCHCSEADVALGSQWHVLGSEE